MMDDYDEEEDGGLVENIDADAVRDLRSAIEELDIRGVKRACDQLGKSMVLAHRAHVESGRFGPHGNAGQDIHSFSMMTSICDEIKALGPKSLEPGCEYTALNCMRRAVKCAVSVAYELPRSWGPEDAEYFGESVAFGSWKLSLEFFLHQMAMRDVRWHRCESRLITAVGVLACRMKGEPTHHALQRALYALGGALGAPAVSGRIQTLVDCAILDKMHGRFDHSSHDYVVDVIDHVVSGINSDDGFCFVDGLLDCITSRSFKRSKKHLINMLGMLLEDAKAPDADWTPLEASWDTGVRFVKYHAKKFYKALWDKFRRKWFAPWKVANFWFKAATQTALDPTSASGIVAVERDMSVELGPKEAREWALSTLRKVAGKAMLIGNKRKLEVAIEAICERVHA